MGTVLVNYYYGNQESKSDDKYKEQLEDYKTYFFSNYKIVKCLGSGMNGTVYLVQHKKNEKMVYAMKVFIKLEEPAREQKGEENEEEIFEKLEKHKELPDYYYTKIERHIMVRISKINDPFLLRIKCAFQDSENFYIITEYIQGKDLWHYFLKSKKFGGEVAKFYAIEILLGLESLHDLDIAHRDVT